MAQGTRGRWIRAATTGFGVLLCTNLVGCMNWDKPKETKSTVQPKAGLPGTPMLPQNNGAVSRTGQPGAGQFTGTGANLQQPGFATSGSTGGFRPGTNGLNTNTGTAGQSQNWPAQPGNPGTIGSPTPPGVSVQPAGGVSAAPSTNTGVSTAGYNPPAPALLEGPLPPPAPPLGGSSASEFAGAPVLPPTPPAPIAPPPTPPGAAPIYSGKGNF